MKITTIREILTEKISGEWGDEAIDGQGVAVIRTANFLNTGKINFSNLVRREIDKNKVTKKKLISGDIIIEKSGGSPTQPVGRVVLFQNPDNDTYLCNNFTSILRPNKNDVYPEFLFFVLHDNHRKGKTLRYQNKTTGIINLKLDSYLDSEINLPSLNDQIRIAHLLGKVEGLIAQRKQHLQQLDDLLKSVFLEMFGDPVRNENGWKPTTIGDSVAIQSGQVDPRELPYSEMLHVGGANIESESGNFIDLKQAKHENLISGKYFFDSAFILYSKIRPYLNKVAKPNFQGICSADIYPIKPIDGLINRDFLRTLLMSKSFLQYTSNNSDRANIPKINRKALIAFEFHRPPIELQNQFASIVEKAEKIKTLYQRSFNDLESLYGVLSQQAFKGELDLSRVPLPTEYAKRNAEEIDTATSVKISIPLSDFFRIPQAANTADVRTPEGRTAFLRIMLSAWLEQFSHKLFSLTDLMGNVQNKLWDLTDGELHLNTDDYDQIKNWLFEALKSEKLEQTYDDSNNRVQLKPRSAKGKLA